MAYSVDVIAYFADVMAYFADVMAYSVDVITDMSCPFSIFYSLLSFILSLLTIP